MTKLTILIPTLNRPDFLYRTLKFYFDLKCDYKFIIGDASNGALAVKNQEICDRFGGLYVPLPGVSIAETINLLNDLVSTPYVVLLPDDDLLMPNGIEKSIKLLDAKRIAGHPNEYISVNGKSAIFMLKNPGAFGKIRDLGDYKLAFVCGTTPLARFNYFADNTCVIIFSIYRIEPWRKMWKHVHKCKEVGMTAETIPCFMSAVLGPTFHGYWLYLLRQDHDKRVFGQSGIELINNSEFKKAMDVFVEELSSYVHVDTIRNYLFRYINILRSKEGVRKKRRSIPLLSRLKIVYLNTKRDVSLPKLRNKSHPDYKDFKAFENLLKSKLGV